MSMHSTGPTNVYNFQENYMHADLTTEISNISLDEIAPVEMLKNHSPIYPKLIFENTQKSETNHVIMQHPFADIG